jgi:hypothetical protein
MLRKRQVVNKRYCWKICRSCGISNLENIVFVGEASLRDIAFQEMSLVKNALGKICCWLLMKSVMDVIGERWICGKKLVLESN